jgi:putative transposase
VQYATLLHPTVCGEAKKYLFLVIIHSDFHCKKWALSQRSLYAQLSTRLPSWWTYFFTVNLLERGDNDLMTRHIDTLRDAVRVVRRKYPFVIHGWVVLPDHLHCVIQLPEGDADFSLRWRFIKQRFSRSLPVMERRSSVRICRGERGIWQRRFWEHLIRDEKDYVTHMDYVHINPLKHGLVETVVDWPFSTFHRLVKEGVCPRNWAGTAGVDKLGYDD